MLAKPHKIGLSQTGVSNYDNNEHTSNNVEKNHHVRGYAVLGCIVVLSVSAHDVCVSQDSWTRA